MNPFQFVAPLQRVVFGPDIIDTAGQEADKLGCRRAFLVAGPNTSRTALYERVCRALGTRCVGEFTGGQTHSLMPASGMPTRAGGCPGSPVIAMS